MLRVIDLSIRLMKPTLDFNFALTTQIALIK